MGAYDQASLSEGKKLVVKKAGADSIELDNTAFDPANKATWEFVVYVLPSALTQQKVAEGKDFLESFVQLESGIGQARFTHLIPPRQITTASVNTTPALGAKLPIVGGAFQARGEKCRLTIKRSEIAGILGTVEFLASVCPGALVSHPVSYPQITDTVSGGLNVAFVGVPAFATGVRFLQFSTAGDADKIKFVDANLGDVLGSGFVQMGNLIFTDPQAGRGYYPLHPDCCFIVYNTFDNILNRKFVAQFEITE